MVNPRWRIKWRHLMTYDITTKKYGITLGNLFRCALTEWEPLGGVPSTPPSCTTVGVWVAPREYRIPSHPQGVSSSHLIGSLAPVEQEDERPCMVMRLMMRPLHCLGLRLELEQKPWEPGFLLDEYPCLLCRHTFLTELSFHRLL